MPDLRIKKKKYDEEYKCYKGNETYDGDIKSFRGGILYAGRTMLGTDEAGKRIYDLIIHQN